MSAHAATPDTAGARTRRLAWTGLASRVDDRLDARPRLGWAIATLLLAIAAIVIVVPGATAPNGVSPIDEYDYTDALDKANRGELSNTGDKVDGYARQVTVCRGLVEVLAPDPERCGTPLTDTDVPRNGYSAADIHPPTYFFLTAGASKVVRAAGLTDDLLISGRLVGALWLMLGMLAMLALARAWGARWTMPFLTSVAVGASPLLVSVSAYLTPDAMGLLVGSLVMLAVTLWQQGRLPIAILVLAAVVPAFVKVPFVLAPLFAAVMLLASSVLGRLPWRRALIGCGVLVVGAGLSAVAWQLIRQALAVGVPTLHPDGPSVSIASFGRFVGYYLEVIPVTSGAPMPVPTLLVVAVKPLMWLLLAASLGGLLFRRVDDRLQAVRWAGFLGMALGSVVLSLIVLLASGGFLIGQVRYGLGVLPLYAVPLMCTRHPLAVLGVAVAAGGSLIAHVGLW